MAKFMAKFIQSRQVSKELHCFGYKKRAVYIMNVWGYKEILPTKQIISTFTPDYLQQWVYSISLRLQLNFEK